MAKGGMVGLWKIEEKSEETQTTKLLSGLLKFASATLIPIIGWVRHQLNPSAKVVRKAVEQNTSYLILSFVLLEEFLEITFLPQAATT